MKAPKCRQRKLECTFKLIKGEWKLLVSKIQGLPPPPPLQTGRCLHSTHFKICVMRRLLLRLQWLCTWDWVKKKKKKLTRIAVNRACQRFWSREVKWIKARDDLWTWRQAWKGVDTGGAWSLQRGLQGCSRHHSLWDNHVQSSPLTVVPGPPQPALKKINIPQNLLLCGSWICFVHGCV